jgi:hypothetical protein
VGFFYFTSKSRAKSGLCSTFAWGVGGSLTVKVGCCQDFFSKIFSKKILDFPLVKPQVYGVNKKWIPRSQRWTLAERQEKKLQAKNARELRIMFWRESQAFRLQIEKEISEKVLARREALG